MSDRSADQEKLPATGAKANLRWWIVLVSVVSLLVIAWFRFLSPLERNKELEQLVEERLGGTVYFHNDNLFNAASIVIRDPGRKAKFIYFGVGEPTSGDLPWDELAEGGIDRVIGLTLNRRAVGDEGMGEVARAGFSALHQIDVSECGITDAGLVELAKMKSLRHVTASGNEISNAGTRTLAAMSQLWGVHLERTQVGDEGLVEMAALPELTFVAVRETGVTGAGVQAFFQKAAEVHGFWGDADGMSDDAVDDLLRHRATLTSLQILDSKLSDEGVNKLVAGLPELSVLNLSGSEISDAAMSAIGSLVNLQTLILNETQVSDLGVEKLKTLTQLERLELNATNVGDGLANALDGIRTLEHLEVKNTAVTDIGAELLKEHVRWGARGLIR